MKAMRIIILLVLGLLFLSGCTPEPLVKDKIRGVSYVSGRQEIGPEQVKPLLRLHAGYASIMPYGFLKDTTENTIVYNTRRQWFGEREEGVKQYALHLRQQDIRIMIKPHLWIGRGVFTGSLVKHKEEDWRALEASYRDYILTYACLAEEIGAELFCIGTELHGFAQRRPAFFRSLIAEVREVYSGKLTYAENWDQFATIEFWDDLDYIGVDAYFPLSELSTPTIAELREEWSQYTGEMEDLAFSLKKPVLFTEFGYRSINYNAREPWQSHRTEGEINHKAQVNALTALFDEVWNRPWFAGGFLWKWFPFHERAGGEEDNRFTVQNKPAEEVVRAVYKQKK